MACHLTVEGSYNVRDLGGYPIQGGHYTRIGVFVRAGNLDKVTPMGREQLLDLGVRMIIDLRDEWEARDYPCVFARSRDVRYVNLPLAGNSLSRDKHWHTATHSYTSLHELYAVYLE